MDTRYHLIRDIDRDDDNYQRFRILRNSKICISNCQSIEELAEDFKTSVNPPYKKEMFFNGYGADLNSKDGWKWGESGNLYGGPLTSEQKKEFYELIGVE